MEAGVWLQWSVAEKALSLIEMLTGHSNEALQCSTNTLLPCMQIQFKGIGAYRTLAADAH